MGGRTMRVCVLRLLLHALLLACMAVALPWPSFVAMAQTSADGCWEYDLAEDGSAHVTAYKGTGISELDIPRDIDGHALVAIGNDAFANNTELTSVYFPSTIIQLGEGAFAGCTSLVHAELYAMAELQDVPARLFEGCAALSSVVIPASAQGVGASAFADCTALTSVSFQDPSNTQTIGDEAFSGCAALAAIDLPPKLTTLGTRAFADCNSLAAISFSMGSSLSRINDEAFSGCTSLAEGVFPSSVTSIGQHVYSNCSSMHTVAFGGSPYAIKADGQQWTVWPPEFDGSPVDMVYALYDGTMFFDATDFRLSTSTSFVTYSDLGDNKVQITGFYMYSSPSTLEIPATIADKTVTRLSNTTWQLIGSVASVTFPEDSQVETIDSGFFQGLGNLSDVRLPASLTSLGDNAFCDCGSLTSVTFAGTKLKSIGAGCFARCGKLEELHVPEGVTAIGDSAFTDCSAIKRLYLPTTITKLGALFRGSAVPEAPAPELIAMPDAPTAIEADPATLFKDAVMSGCTLQVTFGSWSDAKLAGQLISDPRKASEPTLGYAPVDLNDESVTIVDEPLYYAGRGTSAFNVYPTSAVTRWGKAATVGSDYTLQLVDGVDYTKAGVAQIVFAGDDTHFSGSRSYTYNILPHDIKDGVWYDPATYSMPQMPSFAWDDDPWVPLCDNSPTEPHKSPMQVIMEFPPMGEPNAPHYQYLPDTFSPYITDFSVTYQDNTDAGTAKAVVAGLGDYCGTLTLEFAITKRDLAEAAVLVDPQRYTGSALTPKPTSVTILKRDGKTPLDLIEGLDYELSYRDNVEPGKATMVLSALEDSNLTGTIEVPFDIVKEEQARREEDHAPQQASGGQQAAGNSEGERKNASQGAAAGTQQAAKQASRSLPQTSDVAALPPASLAVAGVALVPLGLLRKRELCASPRRQQG